MLLGHELVTAVEYFFFAIKKRPYPRARSAAVSPPQSLRDSSPFGKVGAKVFLLSPFVKGKVARSAEWGLIKSKDNVFLLYPFLKGKVARSVEWGLAEGGVYLI